MNRHARIGYYWVPLIGYAGLIFYISSLPQPHEMMPSLFEEISDKVLHLVEYGILGILCYRALRHAGGPWAAQYPLALAITVSVLYGMTDEVHQAFVPERQAQVGDLIADATGAGVAAWVWHRFAYTSVRRD